MKVFLLSFFFLSIVLHASAQDLNNEDTSLLNVSYGLSQTSFGINPILGQFLSIGIEKPVYRFMVISGNLTGTYMEQKRDYGQGYYFYESCNSIFVGCDYGINLKIRKVKLRPNIGGSFGYFDKRFVTQLSIARSVSGITQFDYFMVNDYGFMPVYNLGLSFNLKIYKKCILSYTFKFIKFEDENVMNLHGLVLKW